MQFTHPLTFMRREVGSLYGCNIALSGFYLVLIKDFIRTFVVFLNSSNVILEPTIMLLHRYSIFSLFWYICICVEEWLQLEIAVRWLPIAMLDDLCQIILLLTNKKIWVLILQENASIQIVVGKTFDYLVLGSPKNVFLEVSLFFPLHMQFNTLCPYLLFLSVMLIVRGVHNRVPG